jgi:DNA-binding NarL/FixJ family response regulator
VGAHGVRYVRCGPIEEILIAAKLVIGSTTVRTHTYRLRHKLDVRDRAQLVSFAHSVGLL